ncbi:MAG: hypothetical protein MUP03_00505, partial [Anaerolineales bacterium]|nr:hypothetical protein [Anaerolineales bacterium]
MLESSTLDERMIAIELLGEEGDQRALKALRVRMTPVNQELAALITGVGKLKMESGREIIITGV